MLVARTTDLDPYLVASAGTRPVEYEDHWYYFPGPYVSSAMKWLSFQPADYSQFRAMFDHVTDPDELPGMAYFTWRVLLETALDAYPEPVQTSNGEVYQQLIYFQDLPLRLSYQDGFIGYLEEEYVPGEPIFLYLQIHSLSAFDKEFNCYVRDFSLIPPEQIVEERLATIMGER